MLDRHFVEGNVSDRIRHKDATQSFILFIIKDEVYGYILKEHKQVLVFPESSKAIPPLFDQDCVCPRLVSMIRSVSI